MINKVLLYLALHMCASMFYEKQETVQDSVVRLYSMDKNCIVQRFGTCRS